MQQHKDGTAGKQYFIRYKIDKLQETGKTKMKVKVKVGDQKCNQREWIKRKKCRRERINRHGMRGLNEKGKKITLRDILGRKARN